ncbi:MAG TPA: hypothetical protein VLG50_02535 [Candidatus Saccharimonadales bacterium]|nr:hypothetical protein [Candidatus Saccharimonadales bacterium]
MSNVSIREPKLDDKENFLAAMQRSQALHYPWVKAPLTSQEFDEYFQRFQQPNQKSFLVCDQSDNIVGVFNVSEIVRGLFVTFRQACVSLLNYIETSLKTGKVLNILILKIKLYYDCSTCLFYLQWK